MNLQNLSSEALLAHIELLKKTIPQAYVKPVVPESREEKMFRLMRKSLSIIEAVYFQNKDMFTAARMDVYQEIIEGLNDLGFDYQGHPEIMDKLSSKVIMGAKLPMKKAQRKADKITSQRNQKAG